MARTPCKMRPCTTSPSRSGLREVWSWRLLVLRQDFARVHRGLDLFGVRYFLDKPGRGAELPGLRLLGTSDLDVLESETAWPRAFFTDSVLKYEKLPDMVRLAQEGDGRPFAAMLPAERARLSLPATDFAQRKIVPAHNYRLTQNTTTFEIDAPSAGAAVLGEAWVPRDIRRAGRWTAAAEVLPMWSPRLPARWRSPRLAIMWCNFSYWPAVLGSALSLAGCGLTGLLVTLWIVCAPHSQPLPPCLFPRHPRPRWWDKSDQLRTTFAHMERYFAANYGYSFCQGLAVLLGMIGMGPVTWPAVGGEAAAKAGWGLHAAWGAAVYLFLEGSLAVFQAPGRESGIPP